MAHANGVPCWMDLLTSDTERAREFYAAVLGWTAAEASEEFGGYFMFFADGVPVAGCMPAQHGVDIADVWGTYLAEDDAEAALARVTANGGAVRVPATPVADLGIQAIAEDPSGARIGVWQPGTFPGFGPVGTGKPGTPAWFQLEASEHAGAVAFYRDALGWQPKVVSDTDEFRLTAIEDDGTGTAQPVAGIMGVTGRQPAGEAARWEIFISVGDADKALAAAVELGGKILSEPEDTPFGRIGWGADPMGARFSVVSRG
jgi:predicted enzyme related to lactoylglutathione lyase